MLPSTRVIRLLLLPACTLALLAAAGPAAAHEAAEAAELGPSHAAEHAAQERALRRWARLPGRERRRQTRVAQRRSLAFERSLALPGPEVVGAWSQPYALPGYAINTVLMPTGKVLYWDRKPVIEGQGRPDGSRAYLWDPAKPTEPAKDVSPEPFDVDGDGDTEEVPLFCSGQSLLPTGEVFAAGGTLAQWKSVTENWKGARFAMTFDPWTETWTRQPDMRHGRWYPGQGQLADGRIVVVSGLDESGATPDRMNVDLEVFTPSPVRGGQGSWARYDASSIDPGTGFYPHLFTLPNGKMLLLGPYQSDVALLDPAKLDSGQSAWTQLPDLNAWHPTGNAVLLPGGPSGSWRAAIVGGHFDSDQGGPLPPESIPTAEVGDLSAPQLTWQGLPDLNVARSNANLVLLPDRSMVTIGGAAGIQGPAGQNFVGSPPDQRLKQVELYRPGAAEWELGPAEQKFRSYHSTALLLPDGRVLSAGDDYWGPNDTPDPTLGTDTAEIYSPPYVFQGARPAITAAPQTLQTGDHFHVSVANGPATRAVLMAPGAVTHGNDMNQRHVELEVVGGDAGGIDLVAPPSTAVAPPGWYMLFVLAADGTPSEAHWIQLGPRAPEPPPPPPPPPAEPTGTPTPTATPTPTPTPAPPAADTRPPALRARLARPSRRGGPALLRLTLDEAGSVRVSARAGAKRTRRTVTLSAGRARTVGVALPHRRRIRVTVSLEARDAAGNKTTRRLVKMLRR
jgi:hypothetical protein